MTYYEAYSKCNIDEFVAMVKTDKAFAEYYDPDRLKCIDDAARTVIAVNFADWLAFPYEMYDLLGGGLAIIFEVIINILRIIVLTTCAIYGIIKVYEVAHKPPPCDTCKKLMIKRKWPKSYQHKYYCEYENCFDRAPEICSKYEKRNDTMKPQDFLKEINRMCDPESLRPTVNWIKRGYVCGENEYECSARHETEWRTNEKKMKYCMFCGARMVSAND